MTPQIAETVLRRSITVEAPIDRAFKVFTEGISTWWPADHHIIEGDLAGIVFGTFAQAMPPLERSLGPEIAGRVRYSF